MKKEYNLTKLRVKRRGARIPGSAKVMKTIRLDADVLAWLVEQAGERGLGYQTLINMLLRDVMNGSLRPALDLKKEIRKIVREEFKRAWWGGNMEEWVRVVPCAYRGDTCLAPARRIVYRPGSSNQRP